MNNIYIYDGGFISFISLVVELIKRKVKPDNIKLIDSYQKSLFDNEIIINIDNYKENIELIKKRISKEVEYIIYNVFLSNDDNKEILIHNFLLAYFKYGNKVFYLRRIDSVNKCLNISKRVRGEAHKLKGFLRFSLMNNNFYYGEISPDNNVIGILSNHFKKRLKEEYWIIKDINREIYAIYDKKDIYYLTDEEVVSLNLDKGKEECLIEDLWKTFHKTVAIPSRKNLRCQQNFMPKKYWKNMLEMENEL